MKLRHLLEAQVIPQHTPEQIKENKLAKQKFRRLIKDHNLNQFSLYDFMDVDPAGKVLFASKDGSDNVAYLMVQYADWAKTTVDYTNLFEVLGWFGVDEEWDIQDIEQMLTPTSFKNGIAELDQVFDQFKDPVNWEKIRDY